MNLHIFTRGHPEVSKMIKFRDRLRSHISDLKLYESKKRKLAARMWKCVQDYADAKTEVIQEISGRIKTEHPE